VTEGAEARGRRITGLTGTGNQIFRQRDHSARSHSNHCARARITVQRNGRRR
jgi:hypothetical protein